MRSPDESIEILDSAIRNICDHLQERSSTLFLGAGVNAGIRNPDGVSCPLGSDLSKWVCRDLLASPDVNIPLDEAVEIARYRVGPKIVNDYLYDALRVFVPGAAHLALVQLPWDVIYTTNFDLLVEGAAESGVVVPAGPIKKVLTSTTSLTQFSEDDTLYYKLHGTIDLANTPDGRLILTKDDYRFYEEYKRPLFRRLQTDLTSKNFVFVGYGLADPNFRAVLDDCRNELQTETLPLSYAVQYDFSEIQETYWREKYNIQLIKSDATEFLVKLRNTWVEEGCAVAPFADRQGRAYLKVDSATQFQKVGDSFYLFRSGDCAGVADPKPFFRGAEPTWANIRERIAPHRDAYDNLFEAIYPEIAEPNVGPSALLVTGSAGTGKTTLIRSFLYDVADAFGTPIFIHIPGTPLDTRVLTPLIRADEPQRFIVLVDSAAEYMKELGFFWEEIKLKRLPITLLLEERMNQWLVARTSSKTKLDPAEITLGSLSRAEIERILQGLAKYDALEKLTAVPYDEQLAHFTLLAHEDLLVALRELTTVGEFDVIVRKEYDAIPSEQAKKAYVCVASVGKLEISVRFETLMRVLNLKHNQLGPDILTPTEGVLIAGEEAGRSRHNYGFRLRPRHPVIASIIFDYGAPTDQQKFEVLNGILSSLDPGFPEDARLLQEITRRRELANSFVQFDMRRALYDRIATILPNNGFVFQHRSILEREMRDPENAIKFARMAVRLQQQNASFQNTLGLALEFAARGKDIDPLKRKALWSEAEKLFRDSIQREPTDAYNYIGLANIMRNRGDSKAGDAGEKEGSLSLLTLFEDAYEATRQSPIIAGELAKEKEKLGSLDQALEVVNRATKKDPLNYRLKQLQVDLAVEKGTFDDALRFAIEAAKANPASWRAQRSLARIRASLDAAIDTVRGNYEAAIRNNKGDVGLVIELGAYLFKKGAYEQSRQAFETLRQVTMSSQERNRPRELWLGTDGQPIVFVGTVSKLAGAAGTAMAVPANFTAFFWRAMADSFLREGDRVTFQVAFNFQGAIATKIRRAA